MKYIMKLSDFDYSLPKELIAQKPAGKRDESRLMVVSKGKKGKININNNGVNNIFIEHKHFYDIADYLKEGDVLVVNDTKVLPFKFHGRKETGGKAEMILGNKIVDGKYYAIGKNRYECRIKTTKARIGTELIFEDKNYSHNNCANNYNDKDNEDNNKHLKEKHSHETCWSMPKHHRENETRSCKEIKSCDKIQKIKATVVDKINDKYIIEFDENYSVKELSEIGEMPLPPYIKEYKGDVSRYQTVYSKYHASKCQTACPKCHDDKNKKSHSENSGSIAAPTAGLHFTDELLEKLRNKGVKIVKVCLHVSFGTFIPVRDDDIIKHKMEAEYYIVDENSAKVINERNSILKDKSKGREENRTNGRLFVVGTTALKTLETVADEKGIIHAKEGWSNLFIYPGHKFKVKVDGFITNFHLPKSTLIMLVSAFFGRDDILDAYNIAVKEKYRFFSFGDAMMLVK